VNGDIRRRQPPGKRNGPRQIACPGGTSAPQLLLK
jgi:hypothetical protein